MRKMCLEMVYRLAQANERVVFIGSDLGAGVLDHFKKEMPDRFFMEGVSEQHVIGMAAGMALEGNIVYVHTIAPFLTRRCYEQIVLDLALHNLNVRLLGTGGGLVYAPLGPTHLALEDLAIMRAIPNMVVVAPADAVEMEQAMLASLNHKGPMYIRIAKGGERIVTPKKRIFRIGKAYPVRRGQDVLLVTTGVTLQEAIGAADILANQKISVAILHFPTVKPFDSRTLIRLAKVVKAVVAIEEHQATGGLGSAVADSLLSAGYWGKFAKIAIPDVFPSGYGSQAEQMSALGISSHNIIRTIQKMSSIR